jgi:rhodanese-related sulfurtransferase
VYKFVCDDLTYDDFDIEDFMPGGVYSCVEERIEEHETYYSVFINGESSPIISLCGDEGSWDKFTDFCFGSTNESIVMKYSQFNEGKKDKFPNVKKLDIDGFVVYIGRDALSNDHLTFNMSHPEDIWMHAKGVPGSHVIIRVRENLPTKEILKKVAELVIKNSKSKSDKTTVVYCQRKFVKKEKGMNPGQVKVDYVNAEEIVIGN